MAQWGNKRQAVTVSPTTTVETSEGAPIGTYTLVKAGGGDNANFGNTSGSRANTDLAMYKALTPFPTMPNMKVSIVPISVNDMSNPNVTVVTQTLTVNVTDNGQGYVAPVTADAVFGNGYTAVGFFTARVANGNLTTIDQTTPSAGGTVYSSVPTVINLTPTKRMSVTAANAVGFDTATDMILVPNANQWLRVNDTIFYSVDTGETPIAPLTANTNYLVFSTNSTGFQLKLVGSNPVIKITDARTTGTEVHTFYGRAGTLGAVTVSNAYSGGLGADATPSPVAHAGWVVKREGTGGRAGRVHYETLVAMHSLANT